MSPGCIASVGRKDATRPCVDPTWPPWYEIAMVSAAVPPITKSRTASTNVPLELLYRLMVARLVGTAVVFEPRAAWRGLKSLYLRAGLKRSVSISLVRRAHQAVDEFTCKCGSGDALRGGVNRDVDGRTGTNPRDG